MALEKKYVAVQSKYRNIIQRKWKESSKETKEVTDQSEEKYQILAKHRYKLFSEKRQQYENSGLFLPSSMAHKSYDDLDVVDVSYLLRFNRDKRRISQAAFIQKLMESHLLHSMPLVKKIQGTTPASILEMARPHRRKSSGKSIQDKMKSVKRPISQTPQKQNQQMSAAAIDPTHDNEVAKHRISKVLDISRKYHECTSSATAGLDLLYDKISSGIRILHDIQAGNSLLATVQRERHRMKVLDMLKQQNIEKTGREGLDYRSSLVLAPKIFGTTTTKLSLVNNLPKCLLPPKPPQTKGMVSSDGAEQIIIEPSKERIKINFFAKMKSLYCILCFLHNVSEEDLVPNEPMPYPQIKLLCKKLQITVRTSHPYVKRLQDYLHFQRRQDGKIGGTSGRRLKWSPSFEVLPTQWDLLEHEGDCPPRSLPVWKRKVVILQPEKQSVEPKGENWSDNKKNLFIFKNEIAARLKKVLKQHEKVQLRAWSLKSKYLSCGPIVEKQLKRMRNTSYRVRWEEGESIIPEWFTLLIEEMNIVFRNDVVSQEHKQLLQELQQFLYMGTRNIPFVVEKLSLLVMSLPAYYLGIREVHLALEAICQHIIKCSPVLISSLKSIRKLPSVVELQPPKYLFGHLIYAEDY